VLCVVLSVSHSVMDRVGCVEWVVVGGADVGFEWAGAGVWVGGGGG